MGKYSQEFIDLVKKSKENTYIGRGNPNANILFVGQEYSGPYNEYEFKKEYWVHQIEKDSLEIPSYKKDVLGGHIWNKYQMLYDFISQRKPKKIFDFESNVFTTEMSEIPGKNGRIARSHPEFKERLQKRKEEFFKSEFFLKFPVVVLACGRDYIVNKGETREIDDIFQVSFSGISKKFTVYNTYWVHYNTDKTRLVIHTRNLSNNVSTKLLQEMGKQIREHLKSQNLNF